MERQTGMANVRKSLELFRECEKLVPGGTQLLSRRPSMFAFGVAPIFATHAKGARFWDVDGNEFIDLTGGIGAVLLGYADDEVDNACVEQLRKSTIFPILAPVELELARELVQTIPCAEMVRLGKSGGEADAVAVRMARGFTGRDRVAVCGYHGWHDWYISANLKADGALAEHLMPDVPTKGVPKALAGTALPFAFNDIASLEAVLRSAPGEFACVILEAARFKQPQGTFLADVVELAHRHGALVIFDEVVTGFRYAPGGAQEYFGVTPDLATFGKAIANGYPLTAIVGRRDILQASAGMFISSLYWDDNCTIAAGLACIRKLKRIHAPDIIRAMGTRYMQGWLALAKKAGVPATLLGHPSVLSIKFEMDDPAIRSKATTLYSQEVNKRGVFGSAYFYCTASHREPEIDAILAAAEGALHVIGQALADGNIDKFLEVPAAKPLFSTRMV
ncbi:MAG: aminotransferase class III-fold pyridoxal phosphate-dependent enzyme [Planctomycetota bacterium]